eukprot:Gb_30818 [translate_table: standard]
MSARSPPRHRHDGTSPLPLGMDWSPPPGKWTGRDTVWPHDSRTGWSFCVMIPSWVVLPEAKAADGTLINPTVFYRVQVGIQSPNGITTIRGILRRFSDFLKLSAAVKRTFPKKRLPAAPPKHSFLRINFSQSLLQERRRTLEEWMGKLLSDIDISRSAPVASFIELEAAARSAIAEISEAQQSSSTSFPVDNFKPPLHLSIASRVAITSSFTSGVPPSTPDYGSDTVYEASDLGTPRQGRDHDFEVEMEDSTAEQDLISGEAVMKNSISEDEQKVVPSISRGGPERENSWRTSVTNKEMGFVDGDSVSGDIIKDDVLSGSRSEFMHETESELQSWHGRKPSLESIGSEISSVRESEISNVGTFNSVSDGPVWLGGGMENTTDDLGISDLHFLKDVQAVLPLHQRGKVKRVLMTFQRRLITAKADMEDLIARLNQEIAVKEFLMTKVKDLEGELDNARHKSRETLQQAVLLERERVTQLQWDLEELRRKVLETDENHKSEQAARVHAETRTQLAEADRERLEHEVGELKEKLQNLQKDRDSLETKAKADMKVLAKEVKLSRKSQPELKQQLQLALKAKSELEAMLQKERQKQEQASAARAKLLHEAEILRQRLQECSVDFLAKEGDKNITNSSSVSDAVDLLTTSDNRIGLLLAEAQLLAQEDENAVETAEHVAARQLHNGLHGNGNESRLDKANVMAGMEAVASEAMVRKMLTDIFIDNAQLRKFLNSVTRSALLAAQKPEKDEGDETPTRKSVLNRFLES